MKDNRVPIFEYLFLLFLSCIVIFLMFQDMESMGNKEELCKNNNGEVIDDKYGDCLINDTLYKMIKVEKEWRILDLNNNLPITNKDIGTLENILMSMVENTLIENGDCLSYTLYYKKYLSKTGLKLDVRKIDLAGVCPIGTKECGDDEGMKHTYLIVNGYGGECILDQHKLACIQVKDEI